MKQHTQECERLRLSIGAEETVYCQCPDTPPPTLDVDIVEYRDGEDGVTLGWHVEWNPNDDFVYCGEISDREMDAHKEEIVDLDCNHFWLLVKDSPGDGMGRLVGKAIDAYAAFELMTMFRDARALRASREEIARLREALEPFAVFAGWVDEGWTGNGYTSETPDNEVIRSTGTLGRDYAYLTMGDLRRAAKALEG